MCCTLYTNARPCSPPARHEYARGRSHMVHNARLIPEKRSPGGEFVDGYWILGLLWPKCRPRIDQFPGCALTLYCTHTVYCRVTKDERYFSTGYIKSVLRVPSVLFACYVRFVYISIYFASPRIISQLYLSIFA